MPSIDNLQGHRTVVAIPYKDAWMANNRGVLAEVARQLNVSRQFVSAVWRGEKPNRRVERALRRRRVPGFESRRAAA